MNKQETQVTGVLLIWAIVMLLMGYTLLDILSVCVAFFIAVLVYYIYEN